MATSAPDPATIRSRTFLGSLALGAAAFLVGVPAVIFGAPVVAGIAGVASIAAMTGILGSSTLSDRTLTNIAQSVTSGLDRITNLGRSTQPEQTAGWSPSALAEFRRISERAYPTPYSGEDRYQVNDPGPHISFPVARVSFTAPPSSGPSALQFPVARRDTTFRPS